MADLRIALAVIALACYGIVLALAIRNSTDTLRRRRRYRAEREAQDERLRIDPDNAIDGETARKEIHGA